MDSKLVSVIIPTKNSSKTLDRCLKSISNQIYSNIEVIIVDSFSTDNTIDISKKYNTKFFKVKTNVSEARNFGINKADGRYILSLDSDMEINQRVIMECVNKIDQGFDAIIIPEISIGKGFWAECKKFEKKNYLGDELIESPRFFNKDMLNKLNGYDPTLVAGEDWDIGIRIKKSGYKIGRIDAIIKHNEGNLSLLKTMKKKYIYGKTLKFYLNKHPEEAKKQLRIIRPNFKKNWKSFMQNPIYAIGMLFMKSCELGSGWVGFIIEKIT
jgi:glycosyltransferase involved in cell wall biosynthesis